MALVKSLVGGPGWPLSGEVAVLQVLGQQVEVHSGTSATAVPESADPKCIPGPLDRTGEEQVQISLKVFHKNWASLIMLLCHYDGSLLYSSFFYYMLK